MQPTVLKLARRYRAVNEPLVPVAWHEGNTLRAGHGFRGFKAQIYRLRRRRVPCPSFAVLAKEGGAFDLKKPRKAPPSAKLFSAA
jgi:hypothetical protein